MNEWTIVEPPADSHDDAAWQAQLDLLASMRAEMDPHFYDEQRTALILGRAMLANPPVVIGAKGTIAARLQRG
jgi:hypothetical protein